MSYPSMMNLPAGSPAKPLPPKSEPAGANTAALTAKIDALEKRLAQMETVLRLKNGGTTVEIRVPGELRIISAKMRIDAPGGLEVQPRLSTSMLEVAGVTTSGYVKCKKINDMRITKVFPFIFPI